MESDIKLIGISESRKNCQKIKHKNGVKLINEDLSIEFENKFLD